MSATPFNYLHDHLPVGGKRASTALRPVEAKPRFRGEDSLMERKSSFKVVQAHEYACRTFLEKNICTALFILGRMLQIVVGHWNEDFTYLHGEPFVMNIYFEY